VPEVTRRVAAGSVEDGGQPTSSRNVLARSVRGWSGVVVGSRHG